MVRARRRRKGKQVARRRLAVAVGSVAVSLLLLALVAMAVSRLAGRGGSGGEAFSAKGYDGIDVSHHQGKIDWPQVARDKRIQFVYIKATEGSSRCDSRYLRNLRQARDAGLSVGSYHFYSCRTGARRQFEYFRRHVPADEQDLLPMIDVEHIGNLSARQLQDSVMLFAMLVKKHYGRYPVIYSHISFYNSYLHPRFDRFVLFMARYGRNEPRLRGDHHHDIWQYSEHGHIRGIKGHVDLDAFADGTTIDDILM